MLLTYWYGGRRLDNAIDRISMRRVNKNSIRAQIDIYPVNMLAIPP